MAETKKIMGKQSVSFAMPPCIIGYSSIAGKKEGEGPLGKCFDVVENDPMFGGSSWEDAESRMQKKAAELAIERSGLKKEDIRYLIGGDLLGQLIATSFGVIDLNIPTFGVYGACSTMGESMSLAAMLVDGGFAKRTLAITSSHFAGAEKQFRFPLDYGNQRPLAATWTVTGSGAVVIGDTDDYQKVKEKGQKALLITEVTTGKAVDYGIKDSMNMGACMAPAAADVIYANLIDLDREAMDYDRIITGDLGKVGSKILKDILKEKGIDLSNNHMDCGVEIYSAKEQDTHAGGSGCGCSAITLAGFVFPKLLSGEWNRVLFVPTGALLSPTSFNEGNSVPGIAHGVVIEAR